MRLKCLSTLPQPPPFPHQLPLLVFFFFFFSALSAVTLAGAVAESSGSGTLEKSEKRYDTAWVVDVELPAASFRNFFHTFY